VGKRFAHPQVIQSRSDELARRCQISKSLNKMNKKSAEEPCCHQQTATNEDTPQESNEKPVEQ